MRLDYIATFNSEVLAATVRHYNKYPTAMVFHGSWGHGSSKKKLKILIDSGCTMPCIVNKRVEITAARLRRSSHVPTRVRTGGGVMETNAKVWHNQHITVGNTSVAVSTITQLDVSSLDYDMILGYPFLTQHNPVPNWKTGELKFKNFIWKPVTTYVNQRAQFAAMCLQGAELETFCDRIKDSERPETCFILASVEDVLGTDTSHEIMDLVGQARSSAKKDTTVSKDLTPEQRKKVEQLLNSYTDGSKGDHQLFTQKDNLPSRDTDAYGSKKHREQFEMELKVDESKTPPHAKPRHMGPKEKAELKRQLIWLLTHGFIQPSKSRYSSPVLFVKKSDGTLRFCIDYRAINDLTATEHYPLPRIPELIDKLSESFYFTALDAVQGYHQFGLTKSSYPYTAFTCPFGHFEYKVIPFGLKNAVGHYQRVMSNLVGEFSPHKDYCVNLIDDLLVHSKTFEEHLIHIAAVLDTAHKARLFLNRRKCMFGYPELKWMGHILGGGTRKPSPDKIKDVQNYPLPTTVAEVRSLLGVMNYLGDYIPNLQQMLAPFADMRKGNSKAKIKLGKDQLEAWENIKTVLTQDCVLRLPNFNLTFFLQTDASEFAIGACLLQAHEEPKTGDKRLFPVEFFSKTLKDAETRYAIYDKELLALMLGMKKFRPYLQHKLFVLLTDHKPLVHLRTQQNLNMRQIRFLEFDAEYDYKIVYIKGEDNIFADFLSRPPSHGVDKSKLSPSMVSSCALCRAQEMEEMYEEFNKYPETNHPIMPPASVMYQHTCGNRTDKVQQADIDQWVDFVGNQNVDDWVLSILATDNNTATVRKKRKRKQHAHHSCQGFPSIAPVFAAFEVNRKHRMRNATLASTTIEGLKNFPLQELIDGYDKDVRTKAIIAELNSEHDDHHYNRKYQLQNGVLYLVMGEKSQIFGERTTSRVYVPDPDNGKLRDRLIKQFHELPTEGHRDADSTYLRCAEHFYFPGMYEAVRIHVKRCLRCQHCKYQTTSTRRHHQPLEVPPAIPWAAIGTDYVTGLPISICTLTKEEFNKIQIYVCRLTTYVILVPGNAHDTMEITAIRYRDRVFPHKGVPKSIVSDRDPLFTGAFMMALGKLFGVDWKFTSGHRPQTNGLSERMVGVLTTMISLFVNYRQSDWSDFLGLFQFALNRVIKKNRGNHSPFEMNQGFNPFSPSDFALPKQLIDDQPALDFNKKQMSAAQHAQDAIIQSQDIVALRMNKNVKYPYKYEVGDKVFLDKNHVFPPGEREKTSTKLRDRWMGPYTITKLVGPLAVKLDLTGDRLLNHPVQHLESVKPVTKGTKFPKAKEVEPGEWLVDSIMGFKWLRNKPVWLVSWGGIHEDGTTMTGSQTWVPLDDLIQVGTTRPIQKLIDYERERTGLVDTLNTSWDYPIKKPLGRTHQFQQWRVYFSKEGDTIFKIAKYLKVSVEDLINQNVMAYAMETDKRGSKFKGKEKLSPIRILPKKTQLRIPKKNG